MGRPRIPDKDKRISEKHIQIMRATYQLLAERGLHQLSLQDVADRLDVSKGVIFYYFKTKERLLLMTWQWVLSRVAERIKRAIMGAKTTEEQVQAMIDAIFIDPDANRTFYLTFVDLIGSVSRDLVFSVLADETRRIEEETYQAVLRQGIERGVFTIKDPSTDAKILRAIIDGLFLQWLHEENWRELHSTYKQLCQDAILRYLGYAKR